MVEKDDDERFTELLTYLKNRARINTQRESLAGRLEELKQRKQTPGDIVRETTNQLSGQLEKSFQNMRDYSRQFAANIIKQRAPELDEAQVRELVDKWVPEKGTQSESTEIPSGVLLTMIHQFVKYSTGRISERELAELKRSIPNWTEHYWRSFPTPIRRLIAAYLKEELPLSSFWSAIGFEIERLRKK